MSNSSSFFNRFSLGFLSLIVETVYMYYILVLLFSGIEIINGISVPISPLFLFSTGGFSLFLNLILLLRRRRLFTHLVVNLVLGGLAVWIILVQAFDDPLLLPRPSGSGLVDGWFIFSNWVVLFGGLWLWKSGRYWAKHNPDYPSRVIRFELTTLLIIGLLFVSTITQLTIPQSALWSFIALIANLSILSLVQAGVDRGPKRLLGPILLALILLPVYLITSLILPGLSSSAGLILETVQTPFQIMKDMLLFIFVKLLQFNPMVPKPLKTDQMNTPSAVTDANHITTLPSWLTSIFQYLLWGLLGFIALFLIGLIGYLLYKLVGHLLKTQESGNVEGLSFRWGQLLSLLRRFIFWTRVRLPQTIVTRPKDLDVLQSYQALIRWGAKRRVPRYRFETPNEYFVKLSKSFPTHTADIQYITDCYVLYFYGPKPSSLPSFQRLAVAVGNLYRRTPE